MAIFVDGLECSLCGAPMWSNRETEIVCFSPLVANLRDPLYLFSDACFHADCLARHPLAEKALARQRELKSQPRPPQCTHCKRIITDPDDFFTFGPLTDEEADPLYRYNYLKFHIL